MGADQSQLLGSDVKQNNVNISINGQEYNVNPQEFGPDTLLVDFIRDKAGLKGTKYMCREGGCGVCVVVVKSKDSGSGSNIMRSVNSCLTRLFSCDGWDITTIERLGNKKDGYHKLQQRLVTFSGTQCGFCTSGMIMNMYSLMQSKKNFKAQDVEDSFDGNVCRCTGYRPILDAFKSMAVDASEELKRKCADYEGCSGCPCALKEESCEDLGTDQADLDEIDKEEFENCTNATKIHLVLQSGEQWVKADSLNTVFSAIQQFQAGGLSYRLVAGNTATGVFKQEEPYQAFLDVNSVPELTKFTIAPSGVILGGGITLTTAMTTLKKAAQTSGFEYTDVMARHLKRVANTPVRNAGTLAGNLMIKHAHREFPSDIFLLMTGVGAKINIATAADAKKLYTMIEFLNMDMNGKVIVSLNLPMLPARGGYRFARFKVTRRYQNSHAYVNAAFLFRVDPRRNFNLREKPNIIYGGINPNFVNATATETFFVGKSLGDMKVVQGALQVLEKEIQPTNIRPDASPEYRKTLTQSLLYKAIIKILGTAVQAKIRTGGNFLEHNLSYGKQTFETNQADWPLTQPIPKLEAVVQCSGEAEYINDIHPRVGELHGAFVLTTEANANIQSIDPSEALNVPGVLRFITAKDIPGPNNFMIFGAEPEEIFLTDKVTAAGHPVGLIVGLDKPTCEKAVKLVKVTYTNVQKPILTIPDAIKKAEEDGTYDNIFANIPGIIEKQISEKKYIKDSKNTVKGQLRIGGQYHFQLETQITICVPTEDGMDVYCATQWMDVVQAVIASCLNMQNNRVHIQVRRLGGGYGSKILRASSVAAACAVAAHVMNKPVRVNLDIESNMKMIGKRLPYYSTYEVGFDDEGKIDNLKSQIICDPGITSNEQTSFLARICLQNVYEATGWEVEAGKVNTNTVSNTYCRAPGSTQGIALIETIMEHIAAYLKKDPLEVRMNNLIKSGDPLFALPGTNFEGENYVPRMMKELNESGDYEKRKKFIQNFNNNNRWMKRGMSICLMRYPCDYWISVCYGCYIAIYHVDGTVAVSHGGIEMGQGINTKVAQVIAYSLKIPLEKIVVKPSDTFIQPNSLLTGACVTSELVCFAATQACKILMERMAPIKEKIKDDNWENVIGACYKEGVDLTANYLPSAIDNLKNYYIWGLNLTEVEVDMLTGEYKVVRLDLIEDVGVCLSPLVDVGQIEGSIAMGLGLWTTEKLQYSEVTGELLTANTWEYKPPFPKDMPEDMRVTFLKNVPNPIGVLGSKATGEPPICISVAVIFSIRNAIDSARKDAGITEYYEIDGPCTPEDILRLARTSKEQFTF